MSDPAMAPSSRSPSPNEGGPRGDDDLVLLRRAQTGDFAAFEQLVARLQARVYRVAFRITGQAADAEDVVQQTFLSLIEHIDSFRGESSVVTWVLRIATNHALKLLRGRRGHVTTFDDHDGHVPHPDFIAPWTLTPDEILQRAELRVLIDQAITELDDRHRVVFVLRDIEGLSTAETAESLGLSESNVKVRLLRARMQLRERLTRALGDASLRQVADHNHEK